MAMASYLPLSGGTVTGALTVNGDVHMVGLSSSYSASNSRSLIVDSITGKLTYTQLDLQKILVNGASSNIQADISSIKLSEMDGNPYALLYSKDGVITEVTLGNNLTLDALGELSAQTSNIKPDWNADPAASDGITNRPTIPAQVQPDWNASSGLGEILNKPSVLFNTKILSLGHWDMSASAPYIDLYGHAIPVIKIRSVEVYIRNDNGTEARDLSHSDTSGVMQGWIEFIDNTKIRVRRLAGGYFDSASFSSLAIIRAYIIINYVD